MKKRNKLLFILAIVLTSFIGIKTVNAQTVSNPYVYCGNAMDGETLISSCAADPVPNPDENDMYTARLLNWYKTGDIFDPGAPLDLSEKYESGCNYIVEVAFKPTEGNSFDFDEENGTVFHQTDRSFGTVIEQDLNGETIVRFYYYPDHVVSFDTDGGSLVASQIVPHRGRPTKPDDPVKDGYVFVGWYEDPEFEQRYVFSWYIYESTTVYAYFVPEENVIHSVNVTLEPPEVGTEVVLNEEKAPDSDIVYFMVQHPKPVAYEQLGNHYILDYSDWVQGLCNYEVDDHSCDHKFTGFIQPNEYYYAFMEVTADDGFIFDKNGVDVIVNGEPADQVYPTSFSEYCTFTAKIKSTGDAITDISKAKVTGIKTQTYNGKQQRQNDLVVTLAGKTLVKDVDYQVLYNSLVNAGTIKMTIRGIGDYEGTLVKTFTRKKAKNTLTVKAYNKTVYYSKVKKAAQVVKPITIVKKQGTVTYTKLSGSSAKLTINKKTGKVTVKKGTKKGKYKIKIKVYAAGNTNYFSNYGIKTVYVTVK